MGMDRARASDSQYLNNADEADETQRVLKCGRWMTSMGIICWSIKKWPQRESCSAQHLLTSLHPCDIGLGLGICNFLFLCSPPGFSAGLGPFYRNLREVHPPPSQSVG